MKNLMKLPSETINIHHNTIINIIIIQGTHNNNTINHLHSIILLNNLIIIIDLIIIIMFLLNSQDDKFKITIKNKIHLAKLTQILVYLIDNHLNSKQLMKLIETHYISIDITLK